MIQWMFLTSDFLFYLLLLFVFFYLVFVYRHDHLQKIWKNIFTKPAAKVSFCIVIFYMIIALLDSMHFIVLKDRFGFKADPYTARSVLDLSLMPLPVINEETYSAPFSKHLYQKEWMPAQTGTMQNLFIPLKYTPHIMGTNKIGQDVFYIAIKSIRTGVLLGSLTTLLMLPFAIIAAIPAGYFGGWIDDLVQFVYITLSSIPGVLLIAASILAMQIYVEAHPNWFLTSTVRADLRLLTLCAILGLTSWTTLCRIIRAETLKLRESDFVLAARAMGKGSIEIMLRHILPNISHLVLITVVLDFSALVMAEAVLTYIGVGVDPNMYSWGNMIAAARLELAREPVVWWPLISAFVLMFIFILAINLFADGVRKGFSPREH